MSEPAHVTLHLFGFRGAARGWAFAQMALARPALARVPGLRFWRLLGSGRGLGFSLAPDWGRYGLLCAWESPAHADAFLADAPVLARYRAHARAAWTARLQPYRSKGSWGGGNPFQPLGPAPAEGPIGVLTRARINPGRLRAFWGAVPGAGAALAGAPGLLASIGIGEAPWVLQATFSLWRSEADLQAYAYQGAAHREVVRRTRAEGWYGEDLFARFRVLSTEGAFPGGAGAQAGR